LIIKRLSWLLFTTFKIYKKKNLKKQASSMQNILVGIYTKMTAKPIQVVSTFMHFSLKYTEKG